MRNRMRWVTVVTLTVVALAGVRVSTAQQQFSWQQPQAKVLETGDLEWAPRPFEFEAGPSVRYIDFATGNDDNDGGSKDRPWKHHPWDPNAAGNAKAGAGNHTYVFKRGVIYRGALLGDGAGTAQQPIRLTSDPNWGSGEAIICGSDPVTGWTRGGDAKMPQAQSVWHADLPSAPRRVWIRNTDGTLTRLTLARTPNWTESNPDDLRSEWLEWEQPEWWTGKNKVQVGDAKCHLGIDTKHLSGDPEQYRDALVWSEYGIVMGSPFASRVEAYYPDRKAIAFQGPWGGDSETLCTGNRYFLEDKPQFLDQPGEFWFDKKADSDGGRLYIRLPGDVDPNTVAVEAAARSTLLSARHLEHVHISGLTFQAGKTFWDLTARPFVHPDIESAGIRLLGSGDDIRISHCRFDQLTGGVRMKAEQDTDRIGLVQISDCQFTNLDRGAIDLSDSSRWAKAEPPFGSLQRVEVLRNRIDRIGLRGGRDCHGHTISVAFADTCEIAGNIVTRVGGAGIFVFGGKGSGELRDKPLSRVLIHHNKVAQSLMMTNDWGGIETWQGGPHYLWSNISNDPGGYWHWSFIGARGKKPQDVDWGAARQGFAYYHDGSSKNYSFNNLAIGRSNELGSPLCSSTAFQMPIGFQNTFFNNTAWRFATAVRRQAPRAGRDKWLGNVFDDMSAWIFLNAEPRGAEKDANAFQFQDVKGSSYALETNAFGANVFHKLPREFGVFEENGNRYKTLTQFADAQKRYGAMRSDVGITSDQPLLTDPQKGDFRPAEASAARDRGVRVFVPWSLYAMVGEWNFTLNQKDPAIVIDEHWYMAPYYANREHYWATPRHALTGVNIAAADYVEGPLEDWTPGALKMDGRSQYLIAKHAEMSKTYEYEVEIDGEKQKRTASGLEIASPDVGTHNLLIEAYLKTEPGHTGGTIVSKAARSAAGRTGYTLSINSSGAVEMALWFGGGVSNVAGGKVNDGQWHHIVAEADRQARTIVIYVDGKQVTSGGSTLEPGVSLANSADLLVGSDGDGHFLAGQIDFLRIARGTLKDAGTSIEELHAWQFDGPQLRDFTGRKPMDGKRDAGAIELLP